MRSRAAGLLRAVAARRTVLWFGSVASTSPTPTRSSPPARPVPCSRHQRRRLIRSGGASAAGLARPAGIGRSRRSGVVLEARRAHVRLLLARQLVEGRPDRLVDSGRVAAQPRAEVAAAGQRAGLEAGNEVVSLPPLDAGAESSSTGSTRRRSGARAAGRWPRLVPGTAICSSPSRTRTNCTAIRPVRPRRELTHAPRWVSAPTRAVVEDDGVLPLSSTSSNSRGRRIFSTSGSRRAIPPGRARRHGSSPRAASVRIGLDACRPRRVEACVNSSFGTSSARLSGTRDQGATSTTVHTEPEPVLART